MSENEQAPARKSHAIPGFATIRCRQGGPLVVELPPDVALRVIDHLGAELPLPADKPVALCRCGASAARPFCDGSHRTSGFPGEPPAPHGG